MEQKKLVTELGKTYLGNEDKNVSGFGTIRILGKSLPSACLYNMVYTVRYAH